MDKEINKEEELIINKQLSTSFVDAATVYTRSDDHCLIQWLAFFPEGPTEQARLIIPKDKLKDVIKYLCAAVNYFPQKPKQKKKLKPIAKKSK
jgi:hypothetical protein